MIDIGGPSDRERTYPPQPTGQVVPTVSVWNLANLLTVLRLVMVPIFIAALFQHDGDDDGWRIAATLIFAAACITDRLDGDLARRRGTVTTFGKVVDPLADKALVGAALIGLSVLDELPWWITILILVRELAITGLRFWVVRYGSGIIPVSRGGRVKAFFQAVAIGLYLLPLPDWLEPLQWLGMAVALVLTVGTGLDYALSAMRSRDAARRRRVRS